MFESRKRHHFPRVENAGTFYRDLVDDFGRDPGTPPQWQEAIGSCVEAGASEPPAQAPEEFDAVAPEIPVRNAIDRALDGRGIRTTGM